MSDAPRTPESFSPPGPPGDRLESWKEIAAYLKRDVRTAQRWERLDGLPIYRHHHGKLGGVYAYRSELDGWWASGRGGLAAPASTESPSFALKRIRPGVALLLGTSVLVGVASIWWIRGGLVRSPAPARAAHLTFHARGWVLVTAFENHTGEPLLDDTLQYALEQDLSESRFVNVVPRERVDDALRLMQQRAGTRVDERRGREICLRDGGIRALVAGRVDRVGSTYLVGVRLVIPSDGRSVASETEEAPNQSALLPALRRIASRLREGLGEELSSARAPDQALETVTTPSLTALRLYTQGMAAVNQDDWLAGAEILQRAVAEDPDFASARILLAHCLRNLRRPAQEYLPHAERAFRLADRTSDRERYVIVGSYYVMIERDEDAAAAYSALVRLYPDHYWGTNNLVAIYNRLGRVQDAVALEVRRAEMRPNDFSANARAAWSLLGRGHLPEARRSATRAQALPRPPPALTANTSFAAIPIFPALDRWYEGDVKGALERVTNVARTLDARLPDDNFLALYIGNLYLALGKPTAAEDAYRRVSAPYPGHLGLAIAALARGDRERARGELRQHFRVSGPDFLTPVLLARTGLVNEAEARIRDLENGALRPGQLSAPAGLRVGKGEVLLARGQRARAIAVLQEGVSVARRGAFVTHYLLLGSESLARALLLQGRTDDAIRVLEATSQEKTGILVPPVAYFWMRNQARLAELYHQVGRESDARRIESELQKLLAYADPDFPLLQQINRAKRDGRPTGALNKGFAIRS